jgi:ATP-dependent helicase/nuclease subunit B
MIEVLVGPANSGKTEAIIARVADTVASGRRGAYLVVPSAPAAIVLSELLNEKTGSLPLGDSQPVVMTFPTLYRTILDKTRTPYQWLYSIDRDRVLRFVIAELARTDQLRYFAETAEMPGLVNSLGAFIEELWRSSISPAAFTCIAEGRGNKDRDIALVFARYAAALAALGAVDAESAGHAASLAIEKAAAPRRWFSLIAVDGFDFLTAKQVRLLSIIAARGADVMAGLTYDEARAIHYWQRPTFTRLRAAGASFIHRTADTKGVIQVAAATLMSEQPAAAFVEGGMTSPPLQESKIEIISAPDRAAEVRAAAREIKRLVIETHITLDDVAIVCRTLSSYAHHIERIFGECAIPVAIDVSLAVSDNPAVAALLRLFNLRGKSFSRRTCLDAWRSPYFDWAAFGFDEHTADLLDAISLAENVTQGRDQWQRAVPVFAENGARERVRAEYDACEDQDDAERRARYDRLAVNLEGWFDALTPLAHATREAHHEWASGLIERCRVVEQAANGKQASRDGSALNQFVSILGAVAHSDLTRRLTHQTDEHASGEISWAAFVAEVEGTLSVVRYDRETAALPCVVALEAHRLRPRRYRAVFVLGLIEGEFPARLTERAPYTPGEREALRQAGVDLTETINDAGADLLAFYKAMSRATTRLYLSFARTDVAGGELLPSYLIEEVQPLIASPVRRIALALSSEAYEMHETCSLAELAMRTAAAQRRSESTGGVADHSAMRAAIRRLDAELPSWRMTERGAQVERRRMTTAARDINSGWIIDETLSGALNQRYGPEHLWSASQINDYGICPFRFFARHTLKLDAWGEPGEGLASHDLGHAYHRILERLYTGLRQRDILVQSQNAEQAIGEAARIAEDVLQQMLDTGEVRRDGLWEFNKEEIKRRVGRLLRREAAWNDAEPARPVLCECKFGMAGAEPLVISCDGGDAKFCGIVDRLDYRRDRDEWVVVDYKTRRTPIPIKDALDGRNLQLPIYAMAATRVIKKEARVAAAYYLHIHSRKRGSELSQEGEAGNSLEQLIHHAEQRIRTYVGRIRNGNFPVQPNGNTVCQACDYSVMCRIQSLRASEDEQEGND